MSVVRNLIAMLSADTASFDRSMQRSGRSVQDFGRETVAGSGRMSTALERIGLSAIGLRGNFARLAMESLALGVGVGAGFRLIHLAAGAVTDQLNKMLNVWTEIDKAEKAATASMITGMESAIRTAQRLAAAGDLAWQRRVAEGAGDKAGALAVEIKQREAHIKVLENSLATVKKRASEGENWGVVRRNEREASKIADAIMQDQFQLRQKKKDLEFMEAAEKRINALHSERIAMIRAERGERESYRWWQEAEADWERENREGQEAFVEMLQWRKQSAWERGPGDGASAASAAGPGQFTVLENSRTSIAGLSMLAKEQKTLESIDAGTRDSAALLGRIYADRGLAE